VCGWICKIERGREGKGEGEREGDRETKSDKRRQRGRKREKEREKERKRVCERDRVNYIFYMLSTRANG